MICSRSSSAAGAAPAAGSSLPSGGSGIAAAEVDTDKRGDGQCDIGESLSRERPTAARIRW